MSQEQAREVPGLVEQLREAIRQSGQSLNQIARASGVGSDRLSRFMTGKRDLTLEAAEKLCRVLRIGLAAADSPGQVVQQPQKSQPPQREETKQQPMQKGKKPGE